MYLSFPEDFPDDAALTKHDISKISKIFPGEHAPGSP